MQRADKTFVIEEKIVDWRKNLQPCVNRGSLTPRFSKDPKRREPHEHAHHARLPVRDPIAPDTRRSRLNATTRSGQSTPRGGCFLSIRFLQERTDTPKPSHRVRRSSHSRDARSRGLGNDIELPLQDGKALPSPSDPGRPQCGLL